MSSRNVFNVEAVDGFVEAVASLSDFEAVREWVCRTVRRWILNSHDRYYRVERDPATKALVLIDLAADGGLVARPLSLPAPKWLNRALADKQKVVFLRLDGTLQKRVRRTIEYLDETADPVSGPSVDRLGFPDAERAARAWRSEKSARRRKQRFGHGVIPVFRAGSNATIVQLTTAESLAEEGDRMRHCASIYAAEVEQGLCEIYSVRDSNGEPQATIEVDPDGQVLQVKGFANGSVAQEFRPALRRFFRTRGYTAVDDVHNVTLAADAFNSDARGLERRLATAEGRQALRGYRYVGGDALAHADAGQVTAILWSRAADLSGNARRAVFDSLLPDPRVPLRLRPAGGAWVYDLFVPVVRVAAPLPFLNLVRRGAFRGLDVEGDGMAIRRAVESRLVSLAFRDDDLLFALGPPPDRLGWASLLWTNTADFLADCSLDISGPRAERHQRIRRRLNEAKARVVGRRAKPSDGHAAVRRLLGGNAGEYVI